LNQSAFLMTTTKNPDRSNVLYPVHTPNDPNGVFLRDPLVDKYTHSLVNGISYDPLIGNYINVPKGTKGIVKQEHSHEFVLFETIFGTFNISKKELIKL